MLALGRELPAECRRDALLLEYVGHLGAREKPTTVHPSAEIRRHSDIGRSRDNAARQLTVGLADLVHQNTETRLRRGCRGRSRRDHLRYVNPWRGETASASLVERLCVNEF